MDTGPSKFAYGKYKTKRHWLKNFKPEQFLIGSRRKILLPGA
jgi:hypothetical protein